jgi:hypothetical protein
MTQTTTLQRPEQVITFIPQVQKTPLPKKAIVLDSGTLINLSMNGLLYIIEELKNITKVKFLITSQVKFETVDRPSNVPRFELGALRVKEMISSGILEMPPSLNISNESIELTTKELKEIANHTVEARGKWIDIVSDAEMSCLALSKELSDKGIENMIAIDERTTRILSEKPENLQKLMSDRLHFNVQLEKNNFSEFNKFKFLRSTELVYVAYKKGLLHIKDPRALEAVLYATKYKGSSVSFDEINILKKL